MKRVVLVVLVTVVLSSLLIASIGTASIDPTEKYPNPMDHPEYYGHPDPYTEDELKKIQEIQDYIKAVNTQHEDLNLYVPDSVIAEIPEEDLDSYKEFIDSFAQEILDSIAATERLDALFEAGDFSSFNKIPVDEALARASHQWGQTADNNPNIHEHLV